MKTTIALLLLLSSSAYAGGFIDIGETSNPGDSSSTRTSSNNRNESSRKGLAFLNCYKEVENKKYKKCVESVMEETPDTIDLKSCQRDVFPKVGWGWKKLKDKCLGLAKYNANKPEPKPDVVAKPEPKPSTGNETTPEALKLCLKIPDSEMAAKVECLSAATSGKPSNNGLEGCFKYSNVILCAEGTYILKSGELTKQVNSLDRTLTKSLVKTNFENEASESYSAQNSLAK